MDEQIKENEKLIYSLIYQFYKNPNPRSIERMVGNMAMDFQDLIQMGRIAYMKAMNTYDNEGGFNGYFCKIFYNDLKMLARKQGQSMRKAEVISMDYITSDEVEDNTTVADLVPDSVNIEEEVYINETYKRVNHYMNTKLSKQERVVFLLGVQGLSTYEIGKQIGNSQRYAWKVLKRVRTNLREELRI